MSQMIEYIKEVNKIPGDGEFWKLDAQETFAEALETLVNLGVSKEEALDFLSRLYYAAASEFGG